MKPITTPKRMSAWVKTGVDMVGKRITKDPANSEIALLVIRSFATAQVVPLIDSLNKLSGLALWKPFCVWIIQSVKNQPAYMEFFKKHASDIGV